MQDKSVFEQAWLVIIGLTIVFFELLFGAITGFDFAALGVALIGGGIAYFFGASWYSAIAVTVAVAAIYFFLIRTRIRKRMLEMTQRIGLSTLVGKQGTVMQSISKKKQGKILVDGEVWNASSNETIPVQSSVTVIAFENNCLVVLP